MDATERVLVFLIGFCATTALSPAFTSSNGLAFGWPF